MGGAPRSLSRPWPRPGHQTPARCPSPPCAAGGPPGRWGESRGAAAPTLEVTFRLKWPSPARGRLRTSGARRLRACLTAGLSAEAAAAARAPLGGAAGRSRGGRAAASAGHALEECSQRHGPLDT